MRHDTDLQAWLVRKNGPLAGTRHLMRGTTLRVGRSPDNDIVIEEAGIVSAHHLEIRRQGACYQICDLNSTNGTYVNGERVAEKTIEPPCTIRLGIEGPELTLLLDSAPSPEMDQTLVAGAAPLPALPPPQPGAAPTIAKEHELLLSSAVARARMLRKRGIGDQTTAIMRDMLNTALHRTSRKFKIVIAALAFALAAVSGYGFWRIEDLKKEKAGLDAQIQNIETLLEKAGQDPAQTDQLIDRLDRYEDQARALQSTLLYRVGVREHEELVGREIRSLMAEFGAETYSIPPEFLQEVNRFIQRYQGSDRPHMQLALGQARGDLETMREIFEENNLPPDLAYMVLVESALSRGESSPAGAAGFWQFTPETAKAYGLKISKSVDERLDIRKATRAACKYIRELILDFGAGSSVMLALAAYNLGPTKVKQAVRKVSDPIKQRNFWYLYRARALPEETREYVPKVIAAMIIARHPDRFGF
jgi:soluble lytic murein transglycosylase-like protein